MLLASVLAIIGGTLVVLIVRDGPFVRATAPFDPHAIRKVLSSRGARLATLGYLGTHVGAVCDVDVGRGVCDGELRGVRRGRRAGAGSIAAFRRDWQRRGGVRAGRLHCRSHRQSSRRDVGNACSAACAALTLVVYGGAPCCSTR